MIIFMQKNMKLSVSNKNPAISAVRELNIISKIQKLISARWNAWSTYPALFAAVFANPLRSPAYSGAKSLGLLLTATAWNASKIMPTVMMVRAQITEQPMIMMKKNRPPPTKKPKNAKIRLLWNNQNVKDRVESHFHSEWNNWKKERSGNSVGNSKDYHNCQT